jgi:hypothetical protein
MASKSIEWSPFARSMGWDPRERYFDQYNNDISDWIKEKRSIIAREQAENIAEMVFNHRSNWHKEVLKTLDEYPKVTDVMMGIVKQRMNDIISVIQDDNNKKKMAQLNGAEYESSFSEKYKTNELVALSNAIKILTESKHKSLLIGDWSLKVADTFTDPKQFQSDSEKQTDQGWSISIRGQENVSNDQLQQMVMRWIDQPQTVIDIDPDPEEGKS